MSLLVLPRGLGWDQLPGDQALGERLRQMFGAGTRLEVSKQLIAGVVVYVAWLVVTHEEDTHLLVAHPLEEGPAELEWWQRDHVLIGWSLSKSQGEAVDRAISCARRGQLARYSLTVWRDRLRSRYLVYERSRRDPETNYRPIGRMLTPELFHELMPSLQ